MEDSPKADGGNGSLRAENFHWGKEEEQIRIGIWAAGSVVEPGEKLELRAAVRNVSNHPTELVHEFGLAVKHDQEITEYSGGPRSSGAIHFEPGEFREILGWSLNEESGLRAGINRCRVIARVAGRELQSAEVEIEVRGSSR